MEFLIFSAFIGFENLHNVLIAYEDKTKLITFYTHLLDTIGYVFLKTFTCTCTSNISFVGFCLTIMSNFFSPNRSYRPPSLGGSTVVFTYNYVEKFSLQTDPNVRP